MLSVMEARAIVLAQSRALPAEITPLMTPSLGQVLSQALLADADSPPFDKSMMDGYAILTSSLNAGFGTFRVTGEVIAGQTAEMSVSAGEAVRVFTGAPIPAGPDAVVMQERTTLDGVTLTVNDPTLKPGRNIIRRGAEMKAGDTVAEPGTRLGPAAFGLMATIGKTSAMAIRRPRVAIVATGNEIVEPNRTPRGAQIRNSNGPMLTAQVARAGGLPRYLGIATDDETALKSYIAEGLEISDTLILAGGVSAGKLDLVPKVLADQGVTIHFHKVKMKPGKPLLFGSQGNKLVFGLPGNPVSAFVGFELFVRPALEKQLGLQVGPLKALRSALTKPLAANHDRPTYHPAKLGDGVEPLPWFGSADLRAILQADAFIVLPEGPVDYPAGAMVDLLPVPL